MGWPAPYLALTQTTLSESGCLATARGLVDAYPPIVQLEKLRNRFQDICCLKWLPLESLPSAAHSLQARLPHATDPA